MAASCKPSCYRHDRELPRDGTLRPGFGCVLMTQVATSTQLMLLLRRALPDGKNYVFAEA
jgi:hypothetical protein